MLHLFGMGLRSILILGLWTALVIAVAVASCRPAAAPTPGLPFDTQAVGYLLKPIRKERLDKALHQAARLTATQLKLVAASDPEAVQRQHIAVSVRDSLRLIPVKDIQFFRADQKYVSVYHTGGEDLIDESLTDLTEEFSAEFLRIHRSILVAVRYLEVAQITIVSRRKKANPTPADLRRQLDEDVEKFLKSGKKIQQIATGVSTQDYSGRKHIILGRPKT